MTETMPVSRRYSPAIPADRGDSLSLWVPGAGVSQRLQVGRLDRVASATDSPARADRRVVSGHPRRSRCDLIIVLIGLMVRDALPLFVPRRIEFIALFTIHHACTTY